MWSIVKVVAAMLFRRVRVSQLLLDDAERMRRFVRTELALPLVHGDAIAGSCPGDDRPQLLASRGSGPM